MIASKEQLFYNILNTICDGVYFVDTEHHILFWNKAAENIAGYTADEVVGKPCADAQLRFMDQDGNALCTEGCPVLDTVADGKPRNERVFIRHKNGHNVPIVTNISPYFENGQIVGAINVFTQESPTVYESDLVERLSGIAMHDTLTGLPADILKASSAISWMNMPASANCLPCCLPISIISAISTTAMGMMSATLF